MVYDRIEVVQSTTRIESGGGVFVIPPPLFFIPVKRKIRPRPAAVQLCASCLQCRAGPSLKTGRELFH
nr:MAG TPA: hypothetical protein [Caudoviricetes sp.]